MRCFYLYCVGLLCINVVAQAQGVISDTRHYPYPYICKVKKYSAGKTFVATGTIVSSNAILTNAHVVKGADSLIFFPGCNKGEQPFGSIKVVCKRDSSVFYPREFDTSNQYHAFDYAIVRFSNEVIYQSVYKQSSLKQFKPAAIEADSLRNLFIAGYPVYHWWELKKNNGELLIQNSTSCAKIARPYILYDLDTRAGSSGSPLWIERNGVPVIIGIHKTGNGKKDEGLLFTTKILERIQIWTGFGLDKKSMQDFSQIHL